MYKNAANKDNTKNTYRSTIVKIVKDLRIFEALKVVINKVH